MTAGERGTPGLRDAGPECSFLVDLRAYSLGALKKAVYALGALAPASIHLLTETEARVDFTPGHPPPDPGALRGQFFRELLDYDLRESIAKETEAVRNLIIAHALSQVPLIHPELEQRVAPQTPSETGIDDGVE